MKINTIIIFAFIWILFKLNLYSFTAKNVFIIIADQFRYDESFGDKTHQYVPRMWKEMAPKGSYVVTFYGNPTFMAQVHLATLTGSWDDVRRLDPKTNPDKPTIFEFYRKNLNKPIESCYFVTSKSEYYYLEYSNNEEYGEEFKPFFEKTKKEQDDDELFTMLVARMKTSKPSLVVVILGKMKSFNKKRKEDEMARYRKQLSETDELIYRIWNEIQNNPQYKNNTDLFFINDHGDLITHEDCDDECKRYLLILGLGPDIKENYVSQEKWRQTNIFPTVLTILGAQVKNKKDVMQDFFKVTK